MSRAVVNNIGKLPLQVVAHGPMLACACRSDITLHSMADSLLRVERPII